MKKSFWSTETFVSVMAAVIIAGVLVSMFHHFLDKNGKILTGHTSSDGQGTALPADHPAATGKTIG
jgi:hypothetical protein